jgi:ribosomal protein S18 acetylase RimI-like enzyme
MRTPRVHVRRAAIEDLETIVRFNLAMAEETEGKKLDTTTVTEGVRAALADPDRSMYFVAEVEGVIAGQTMVTLEWSDWRNGFFWWIQSVYVDPAYRREGVFRALHDHIRNLARAQQEVCGLRLYVHGDNRRAIETYRKLGMGLTDYLLCEEGWSSRRGGATS